MATNFIILPTQRSDVDAVRICGDRAFPDQSFRSYIFPESRAHLTPPEELLEWRRERFQKTLQSGMLHFKCVPEDNHEKVVGYAAWHPPGHFAKHTLSDEWGEGKGKSLESALDQQEGTRPPVLVDEGAVSKEEKKKAFPACVDVELLSETTRILDEERKRIWGQEAKYWYLGGLAVDPDYQGKGLARKLVDMGLEWADRDGIPTYLEATPDGAKIYPRFGFEKVGEHAFFNGEYVTEFHIRQPSTKQTTVTGA